MQPPSDRAEDVPAPFSVSKLTGRRLAISVCDELADITPEHILFSLARSSDPRDGFIDVSCRTFANGVNRSAEWVKAQFGTPQRCEAVAYLGPRRHMPDLCVVLH